MREPSQPIPIEPARGIRPLRRQDERPSDRRKPRAPQPARPVRDPRRRVDEYAGAS